MIDEEKKYIVNASRLVGTVRVSGAKNSALKLLSASLLTNEKIEIKNLPSKILDGKIHIAMLEKLGKKCVAFNDTIIITEPSSIKSQLVWEGPSIRNTLLILGALVARNGKGTVPLPGGCQIGERKFDIHEMLLRKMGAEVWTEENMLCAEVKTRLKGTDIYLPIRSTGATENAIICGSLAEGITRVWNPHVRPEIIDLIGFLRKMGVEITVYGQESIEIKGVDRLTGTSHEVISDNMEAITWLIGSVVTKGDVEIIKFPFEHLEVPLIYLRESGAKFYQGNDSLIVRGGCCYPIDLSTGPYPGINSDMQPLFAVFALCARGESHIIDLRFPDRYAYASELKKMGADLEVRGNILFIRGGNPLKGNRVGATDLRAGAALTLAGLIAEGETVIDNVWQIERGYDGFHEKLNALGAKVHANN